jgi:hypothetical protein
MPPSGFSAFASVSLDGADSTAQFACPGPTPHPRQAADLLPQPVDLCDRMDREVFRVVP